MPPDETAVEDIVRGEELDEAHPAAPAGATTGDDETAPPEPLVDAMALLSQPPAPLPDPLTRIRRWAIGVLLITGIAAVAVTATYTPLFSASHIKVDGLEHLARSRVVRLAGVDGNTNVVRFDERAAERRLERDPWVASAEVSTSLPSTVTIAITEREPVAIAETADGLALVAADGVVLDGAGAAVTMPRIRPVYGTPIPDDSERRLGALVVASMPSGLLSSIAVVVVNGDGTLDLLLSDGVSVSYGTPTEMDAKVESLRAVLRWADREGVRLTSISVESPGAPTADTIESRESGSGSVVVAPDVR